MGQVNTRLKYIRSIFILSLKYNLKNTLTITKLNKVLQDEGILIFKREYLRKLLIQMGFGFQKNQNSHHL